MRAAIVRSVLGRTRTSRSSGSASRVGDLDDLVPRSPGATPSTSACASPPTAPAAGGTAAAPARSSGSSTRAADATARGRRRRARRATRAALPDRSLSRRGEADSCPKPRSMTTGSPGGDEDVRGAQGPMGDAGACHEVDFAPHGVEQVGVDLVEGESVERSTTDVVHRQRDRSVRQRGQRLQPGRADAGAPSEEQQEGLVLGRHRRVTTTASRRSGRAAPGCGSRGTGGRRRGCPG